MAASAVAMVFAAALPFAANAEPRTHVVELGKMAFGPPPANVHVGDTVLWRNKDMFRHTATARSGGSFDVDLPAGAEAGTVMAAPGDIAYYCRFHPAMTGTIRVLP